MPVPSEREVHRRSLLRDDVYLSLRNAIVRGELAPGEKLKDAELGQWLGVSRTPIREALLRLASAGLVQMTPGKLTFVAPEDKQQVLWAQQIAGQLHALATRMAQPNISETDISAMAEANERLRSALSSNDVDEAIKADDDFHHIPVRVSGNPLIAKQLEQVTLMLRRAEYLHFGTMTGSVSPQQHDAIIEAIKTGNADKAAMLAGQNWNNLSP